MYLKDLEVKITCRISAEDYVYLVDLSEEYNCSVSEVVRKLVFTDKVKRGQYDKSTVIDN